MAFSRDIYRAKGVGFEPLKNLSSLWVTAALQSEEGFDPALGTVGKKGKCRLEEGRVQWDPGEKHWCQTEIPLGTLVLCSISLGNFGRDESISLLLGIFILVKTDMNVLTENGFQWIGNCLFWLIAFIS